jgi:sulfatase modifying factor 1
VSPDTNLPAKISPFFLDRLEVTVGRMKQFVKSYSNVHLNNGDGKADHIAADEGWNTAYDLPVDVGALTAMLNCPGTSWTDSEQNASFAANCVSFNVAYAFCIWDGGRLPTDAEWNFAASGGDEQRTYVWGDLDLSPDHGYFADADRLLPTTVGSWPKGNGRWGHADLSGNVSEWVLDYYYADLPEGLCEDCLAADPSDLHTYRGAAFTAEALNQYVVFRGGVDQPLNILGFRCARDLK